MKDIEAEAKSKVCHRTINGKREELQTCMVGRCARWVEDRGCMDNLVFVDFPKADQQSIISGKVTIKELFNGK